MQHLSDTAYVIKRISVGEADRFITLFTKTHGKQEVMAKGIRKVSSRRAPHLELLNKIKFHAISTRKNFILTDVEVIDTYQLVKKDTRTIGFAFLICELIEKLCPVGQAHQDIFNLIDSTLTTLEADAVEERIMHFETQMLTSLGFWDGKRSFVDSNDIEQYIEGITERKIKTRKYLKM